MTIETKATLNSNSRVTVTVNGGCKETLKGAAETAVWNRDCKEVTILRQDGKNYTVKTEIPEEYQDKAIKALVKVIKAFAHGEIESNEVEVKAAEVVAQPEVKTEIFVTIATVYCPFSWKGELETEHYPTIETMLEEIPDIEILHCNPEEGIAVTVKLDAQDKVEEIFDSYGLDYSRHVFKKSAPEPKPEVKAETPTVEVAKFETGKQYNFMDFSTFDADESRSVTIQKRTPKYVYISGDRYLVRVKDGSEYIKFPYDYIHVGEVHAKFLVQENAPALFKPELENVYVDWEGEKIPAADYAEILDGLAITDYTATVYRKNSDGTFTEDRDAWQKIRAAEYKDYEVPGRSVEPEVNPDVRKTIIELAERDCDTLNAAAPAGVSVTHAIEFSGKDFTVEYAIRKGDRILATRYGSTDAQCCLETLDLDAPEPLNEVVNGETLEIIPDCLKDGATMIQVDSPKYGATLTRYSDGRIYYRITTPAEYPTPSTARNVTEEEFFQTLAQRGAWTPDEPPTVDADEYAISQEAMQVAVEAELFADYDAKIYAEVQLWLASIADAEREIANAKQRPTDYPEDFIYWRLDDIRIYEQALADADEDAYHRYKAQKAKVPAEPTTDDFASELARLQADVHTTQTALIAAQEAHETAVDSLKKFLDDTAVALKQKLDAVKIDYVLTLKKASGSTWRVADFSEIYIGAYHVGCDIEFRLEDWIGKIIARYDTPEQVTAAIEQLKSAIERGDKEFTFPTFEKINRAA